jgi:hypothetical protein
VVVPVLVLVVDDMRVRFVVNIRTGGDTVKLKNVQSGVNEQV